MKNSTKAVAFVRVTNTKNNEEAGSLRNQLDLIEKYAAKHKMEVVNIFENYDKKELGFELSEMAGYCRENEDVSAVLVTRFNHITWSLDDLQELLDNFDVTDVAIVPVTDESGSTSNNETTSNKIVRRLKTGG